MQPLEQLYQHRQSIWLDNIHRKLLESGELKSWVKKGLRGLTSNPTIFDKAISGSCDYDAFLSEKVRQNPEITTKDLYEALAIRDIQEAADIMKTVYDSSDGKDGYVSLEVSPELANDTEGTVAEAERLWQTVNRPNLMVKVPATPAGIPAIEKLIGKGINVNVTLMFSLQHYEDVAQAYLNGLRKCAKPQKVASVASFFISRVDGVVDQKLDEIGSKEALELKGKIAIANAKLTYKRFSEIFYGEPFIALLGLGCRCQRPLWASTSTKNPQYPDVLYVEELIGPDTVNTLPPATLDAFCDHGKSATTIDKDWDVAEEQLKALEKLGINFSEVTEKLQQDGVKAFADSFAQLLSSLQEKQNKLKNTA